MRVRARGRGAGPAEDDPAADHESDHDRRGLVGSGLGRGGGDRHVLRVPAGRRHRAPGQDDRAGGARRQVLLRVLLVRGAGRVEDPGAVRRPRWHHRPAGLRRRSARRGQRAPRRRGLLDQPARHPDRLDPERVAVRRGQRAGLLLEVRGQDRHRLLDGGGRDPARFAALPEQGPPGLGAHGVPGVAARLQLPVLQREDAARLELLSLLVRDGREHRGPPAGDALRGRAVRRGVLRPGLSRHGRVHGRRHGDQGQGRHRHEISSRRGHDRGRDDQPGLLAGRGRRRADRRQRTVRALLPGEAAVLSRRGEPPPDADPGDLHAHDHQSRSGARA